LAISTASRSSISASAESSRSSPQCAKVGRGRLQPQQGRGAKRAAEDLDLEFVEGVEGGPAPLDRAAAPLGRVVLTLQRDQRVDAADDGERGDRLR
jgi:hypothetical protein